MEQKTGLSLKMLVTGEEECDRSPKRTSLAGCAASIGADAAMSPSTLYLGKQAWGAVGETGLT